MEPTLYTVYVLDGPSGHTAQTTAVTAAAERLYAEARGMYARCVHRGEGVCTYVCPAQKLDADARGMYAQYVHRSEGVCSYVRSVRTPWRRG